MSASRHLLDPDLLQPLAALSPAPRHVDELPRVRAGIEAGVQASRDRPAHAAIRCSERRIPGPAGAPDVGLRIYRPQDADGPLPAFLWIHGGGFVSGTPDWDFPLQATAMDLPAVIVAVDYRLAPETRFPGALEDCHAALRWLHAQAASLGIDRARIGIGGVSAGGCLAAGLALLARDRGASPIAFQMLLQPKLDDRSCLPGRTRRGAGEFAWTAENNAFSWHCLLGHAPGGDGVPSYAAPARAETLEGLPPCFLSVGALDLFLDEDLDYARRLIHAGVPVELHVYPGACHAFQLIAPESDVARRHGRDVLSALRRALHPTPREHTACAT